jgi:hypothetical protein
VNQNENGNTSEGDGVGCGKRVLRVAASNLRSASRSTAVGSRAARCTSHRRLED